MSEITLSKRVRHGHPQPSALVLVALLLLGFLSPAGDRPVRAQGESTQEEAYRQAVDLTVQGEWQQALVLFRRVARGDSGRAAEASFYTGLCLENLSGRDAEAFEAFEDTRRRFPDEPTARQALLRQIPLAGVLGFSDTRFRDFLVAQLDSAEPTVRTEAALSLGRLGDERAVEKLIEVARNGSPNQRMLVLESVADFEPEAAERLLQGILSGTTDLELRRQAIELQTSLASRAEQRRTTERLLASDVRALMEEIKRQGEDWSDEELITHGLFHIMERRDFVRYVQSTTAERRRIYADFWEGIEDPIPQTPENEMEAEFRRRIQQAHRLYGEPWRAARSQYDAKEWLTSESPYAPWDARGELLIKFGEPSDIFLVGFNQEEWFYGGLRVDFTVSLYRYNYMRNAIFPGRASQQDYPPGYVQGMFINTPRIEFNPIAR